MFTLTVLINILFSNSLDLKVSISIPPKNSIFFFYFSETSKLLTYRDPRYDRGS